MINLETIDIKFDNISCDNSYNVVVGNDLYLSISKFKNFFENKKIIFVIDKNAAYLATKYTDEIKKIAKSVYVVNSPFDKEENKTYHAFEFFCEEILALNPNRKNTVIVVIGGGAIGDSVGFVGATMLRGVDVIRISTTLLSMVDSSVGGKLAINSHKLKNMIGVFCQPKLVICDINFLSTLPKRELLSGYAELLKHALIYDKNIFLELENNVHIWSESIENNIKWITQMVAKSIAIKYDFIKNDEFDLNGQRAILNFGHTIGHAIEKAEETNYLHGEAIAMGMYIEAKIAVMLQKLDQKDLDRIKLHLQQMNLWNTSFMKQDLSYLMELMSFDKKVELDETIEIDNRIVQKNIPIVILKGIGFAELKLDVDYRIVLDAIKMI